MMKTYRVPALRCPADAEIHVPGSKSHANRAIICACLANGETVIRSATPCDDVLVMVENMQKLGFGIEWINKQDGELRIKSMQERPSVGAKDSTLDCHNAGTTIRFLASLAAIQPGEWTLTGDEHMKKRPIGDLTAALRSLGAEISDTNGCPPIRIRGGTMKGGKATLDASTSSQFLTSLLLVAPVLPEGLRLDVSGTLASAGYIDLTQKTMSDFGIQISRESNTFIVHNSNYHAQPTYDIEGDWSAAGAWLVLAALTGSQLRMPELHADSSQSDRRLSKAIAILRTSGDVTLDATEIPDQVMNLAVLAAFRSGTTVMPGLANLRKKECDRLHVITEELRKAGVDIAEQEDGITVRGNGAPVNLARKAKAVTLNPHGDHRMAMAFAILGLLRGGVTIKNPECVAKSYPRFFADVEHIVRSNRPITVIGMRGVGKSSLGRRLAARMRLRHEDSDHLFQDAYGPIKDFIATNGWDDFRTKEEEVIKKALRPGIVLSLGGGALLSSKTRKLVKEQSTVVWLQARETDLIQRLQSGKRPSLTDLPLEQEVRKLLMERGPQYREAAHIEVGPGRRFGEQVPFVIKKLSDMLRSRHL